MTTTSDQLVCGECERPADALDYRGWCGACASRTVCEDLGAAHAAYRWLERAVQQALEVLPASDVARCVHEHVSAAPVVDRPTIRQLEQSANGFGGARAYGAPGIYGADSGPRTS